MSKPKGAIDFTPRLGNNNNNSNNTIPDPRQGFSKQSSTPQQLQQSQLAQHQQQQQEPSTSLLAPKSALNKTTTSPMPRTSTPAYNPFIYTYSRDLRSEQPNSQFQVQQANGVGATNGQIRERGDIFSQPQLQQQSQYVPQQQQYPVKALQQQGLTSQKPIQQQKQQQQLTGNQQLNEQYEMPNNPNSTNEEGKSEVFTSNYRVANTYRPVATSATAQTYLFQQPSSTTQSEQFPTQQITPPPLQYQQQQQQQSSQQQQQGVLLFQDSQKKQPNGKIKLNKSSKSETPLKPILKDFSMTYKQHQQQQSTSQPSYPQQPQQSVNKQLQSSQPQSNQTTTSAAVGGVSTAGNSSTKSNSNSTHVALQQQQLDTPALSTEQQQYGSANILSTYQGQSSSQWSQEGSMNAGQQGPRSGVSATQQYSNPTYSSNPPNNSSSLQNGSRFRSGHQPQSYQRMMSPKTEPSEFGAASLSSQHFYPSKQRSPTKHSSSKEQNNGKYSSGGVISQFPVAQDSSGFILDSLANTSTTSGAPGSLAIKQTPPHSNNLNGLGLVKRKSQTPKRNTAQSVGGNTQIMTGIGENNNNSNLSQAVSGSEKYPILTSLNAPQNQGYISSATGTNSLTVSGNFNNFPITAAATAANQSGQQNSSQAFSNQNRTLLQSANSGRNQRAISPIGQNISSDPTQTTLNALNRLPSNQNQQFNQVSGTPFSSQQTLFGPIQEESSSSNSPVRHKKTTSEITIKEKDPQEMFLIRDQDTGVVYDIRQIDKIDTFSKTNNQEYFDKLKRRHKNAWQGWWNSKKENNLKMLESVRQNNFQIVEQLLQHERADLRADTDFKDPNQWASIHYAAYNGNASILNLLISHEADMSLTNNLEQTALMIAAEKGYGDIAEICIRAGVNVNSQDLNKNTALHFASRNGNLECVRVLLRARDINVNLRNVENKLAVECSKTNEISMQFKDSEAKNAQLLGGQQTDSQGVKGFREEKKEPENPAVAAKGGIGQQEQFKRIAPRNSNYENILSQSVLQGFYGQKLTLSSKNGQAIQNQQTLQSKQQGQPQLTPVLPQQLQPIPSYTNQYQQQQTIPAGNPGTSTSPLILQQAHINQSQQQQQPSNGLQSSSHQQPPNNNNNNNSTNTSKVPQPYPVGTERVSFDQQISMQSSNGGQGFQSSQLSSSSQSVVSNNRSSTYKSGIEQPSPPGGQGMRQSISSQGSSASVNNSQNHLTDSQLTAFSNSGLYNNNTQQLANQQNQQQQQQQQQPWRVIIHDFPNESIMRMFDNTESGIYQPTGNNNSLSQGSNNSNSAQSQQQQQQQSLIYNYSSSNPGDTSQTSNQQPMLNNNDGFGRGSATTPQNANTLVSTNETIVNSGSPSHKHHKVHSQDVLPTSAAANVLRKLPSHSTQSSTTQQGIWQQNQQQLLQQQQQAQMSQQADDNPQQQQQQLQQPKPSEYIGPEQFRIITQIGRGSFGEVYLVEKKNTENNNNNNTNNYFAMKMLHKSKVLGQNLTKYAMTERNVLSIMCHPFIVKLMFAFQTSKDLFLIMEYMPGGDLSHALQRDKRFSESRARIYLVEIMLAIRHLHKHDIIYRDLKPENIVIDAEGHAMLTDFGLSKDGIYDHYSTHSFCGSLAYLAPEMLKRTGHGKAVDYYHLGVLLFEMLTGSPPFFSDTKEEICHNIESQDIRFPSHVSDNARNLISKLLVKNPAKRLGNGKNDFEEMKKHPFFSGINWNQAMQRKLKPPMPFIKPIVDSKNTSTPNFMMTMTPQGMMTDNHINGWSFINTLDQIQTRNNNNFSKF